MEAVALMALLGIGMLGFVVGLGIRTGRLRNWVGVYRDFRQPWFIRNGALAVLPVSGLAVVIPVAKFAMDNRDNPLAFATWLLISPVIVALTVIAVLWAYRAPDNSKPAWLRDEERLYGMPHDPSPRLAMVERGAVFLLLVPLALAAIVVLIGGLRWLILGD